MSLTFQPMMESRPIREIAYEVLKKAIITGEIPAGERIVETDYADRLHISRTPLREALRKLERDGLVEYVMRRGVVVRAFTIDDVREIYTIRNALEMLTLPSIVENATQEDKIAASKAADRLLSLEGVLASFVLCRIDQTVHVSARSSGTVNVQLITEKLHGGGHFDMAGAQVKDATIKETFVQLKAAIDEYLNEA